VARREDSTILKSAIAGAVHPQRILNGEVHNWYRLILGYSDHLVSQLIDRFGIRRGDWILDPFCGSGTTMVECLKRGINGVGIDANPSSCFAARVKTDWRLNGRHLRLQAERAGRLYQTEVRSKRFLSDPTYDYLDGAGFLQRGWISPRPLRKAIALKRSIRALPAASRYKNALMLALISEVINEASNVKFGPELYCGPAKVDYAVFAGFLARVETMAADLATVSELSTSTVAIVEGDSRNCSELQPVSEHAPYSAIISSPPYPTEHDYTRNSRLELAFLERVSDLQSLRAIKKSMIRSHSKGIYVTDRDGEAVERNARVMSVVNELKARAARETSGFARYYPVVAQEYFGGIKKHLASVRTLLKRTGVCAYVLGDQSSYLGVDIPTAEIIRDLAYEVGFGKASIEHWRSRWSTATSRKMEEHILVLHRSS
jgi:hypothetical protein